jgi:hypothetical protein
MVLRRANRGVLDNVTFPAGLRVSSALVLRWCWVRWCCAGAALVLRWCCAGAALVLAALVLR